MRVTVSLPIPVRSEFDYLPGEFADILRPGFRVIVPFGNRLVSGWVTAISDVTVDGLKTIRDVPDEEPLLTAEQLQLAVWMAGFYQASLGETLQAFLPSDLTVKPVVWYRLEKEPESELEWSHSILSLFRKNRVQRATFIQKQLKPVKSGMISLRKLIKEGLITEFRELRDPSGKIRKEYWAVADVNQLAGIKTRSPRLYKLREWLCTQPSANDMGFPATVLKQQFSVTAPQLKSWFEGGILRRTFRFEEDAEPFSPPLSTGFTLTSDQHEAWQPIRTAIHEGGFHPFLLHGVTGSGKTILYMEALKAVLDQGKSGLILVPEIALTPQTVRRFEMVFGSKIGVLHSRRSVNERYLEWRRILSGNHRIVIGPRSALFAPIRNPGIIIVDEEHDSSYKQTEPAPRYNARDTAIYRAMMNKCPVILGSATPSFESYHQALTGKYTLLNLTSRAENAILPVVKVINKPDKEREVVWGPLRDAISSRLEKKESVILLQNRRGFSNFVECNDCGWVPGCPHCAISLTWHKSGNHLRCHYCGFTSRLPESCSRCHSLMIKSVGAGTQQLESLLNQWFPDSPVFRMDQDTTTGKFDHARILDDFRKQTGAILLGTQMVSKGLDFHQVTLVGVIDSDRGLHTPDFRSTERVFQLLTQVAGRSGRGSVPGDVFIQTRQPDLAIFKQVADHEFKVFYEGEIRDRQALGYPPFRRLIRFEIKARKESDTEKYAGQVRSFLEKSFSPGDIRGPVAPMISRISDWYRMQLLLFLPKNFPVNKSFHPLAVSLQELARDSWPSTVRLIIDVDPI